MVLTLPQPKHSSTRKATFLKSKASATNRTKRTRTNLDDVQRTTGGWMGEAREGDMKQEPEKVKQAILESLLKLMGISAVKSANMGPLIIQEGNALRVRVPSAFRAVCGATSWNSSGFKAGFEGRLVDDRVLSNWSVWWSGVVRFGVVRCLRDFRRYQVQSWAFLVGFHGPNGVGYARRKKRPWAGWIDLGPFGVKVVADLSKGAETSDGNGAVARGGADEHPDLRGDEFELQDINKVDTEQPEFPIDESENQDFPSTKPAQQLEEDEPEQNLTKKLNLVTSEMGHARQQSCWLFADLHRQLEGFRGWF
ncbi:hypothetical protein Droror1_Dr00012397 [Drosera rotundifolia]